MFLHKIKRNRTIKYLGLVLLSCIASSQVFAQDISARLYLIAGDEIFANGNMQAKVRIFYTPTNKDDILDFEFKQFGTGEPLINLEWNVSEIDNGFDHNFSSAYRIMVDPDKGDFSTHKDFYISTKLPNSEMTICVEISVNKDENKQSIFSSCDFHGIDYGTVTINSKMPHKFHSSDFIQTPRIPVFGRHSTTKTQWEIAGYQFGLVPGDIPRGFSFKLLKSTAYTVLTKSFIANQKITYASKRVDFADWVKYKASYFGRFLLSTSDNDALKTMSMYNILWKRPDSYNIIKPDPSHIVGILEIILFDRSLLIDQRHCLLHKIEDPDFICYDHKGEFVLLPNNVETLKKVTNKFFTNLLLQDNYGGKHIIKLSTPSW